MCSHNQKLSDFLADEPTVEFAVLVIDNAKPESDWDIPLQWDFTLDWMEVLGRTGKLMRKLSQNLDVSPYKIDRGELRRANLAMRASVAEEGIPLSILTQVP